MTDSSPPGWPRHPREGPQAPDGKVRPSRQPGSRRVPTWWLAVKDEGCLTEVLILDHDGEWALPVFSGGDEAWMFLWLMGTYGDGWRARETSRGELISALCGPCAGARSVALDPLPDAVARTTELVCLSRERFMAHIFPNGATVSGRPGAVGKPCLLRGRSRDRAW